MIPEPESRQDQTGQVRNNNLLCFAAVLFVIGLVILQGLAPLFMFFFPMNAYTWIMIILFGVVPTLGGVYMLWKWWESGS